jgi:hypothetical protein
LRLAERPSSVPTGVLYSRRESSLDWLTYFESRFSRRCIFVSRALPWQREVGRISESRGAREISMVVEPARFEIAPIDRTRNLCQFPCPALPLPSDE